MRFFVQILVSFSCVSSVASVILISFSNLWAMFESLYGIFLLNLIVLNLKSLPSV